MSDSDWFKNIQGYVEIQFGPTGPAEERKHTLQVNAAGDSEGDRTIIFPGAPFTLGGTSTQEQVDDIVDALVALGLAVDNRS